MTQESGERRLGQPYSADRFWRWVEFSHDDVWYYVRIAYLVDAGRAYRYYFISNPSDLVVLMGDTNNEFWIERVMAVIPPRMNGTGCWTMHQLKELVAVAENNNIVDVNYVHKLEGDRVYETRSMPEASALTQRQILFSEQSHATPDDG